MGCEVRIVDEDALPEGQAWVIGVTHQGERFLFVKRGAMTPAVLEQAWAAGLEMTPIPSQRRYPSLLQLRLVT